MPTKLVPLIYDFFSRILTLNAEHPNATLAQFRAHLHLGSLATPSTNNGLAVNPLFPLLSPTPVPTPTPTPTENEWENVVYTQHFN
jgi:hypothetical protein